MRQPHPPTYLLSLALFSCSACGGSAAESAPVPAPDRPGAVQEGPRILAVGDLHGDLEHSLAVLRLAGAVDEQGHWSGGQAVLVQTGDLLDRGDDGVETLDLMQRLQREAAEAGGRVEVLLGNHETMNMLGDLRYVTAGDVAGYGGAEARALALGPGGEDGAWLRQRPAAVRIGRTVFVHGGITPAMAELGLEQLNARVQAAVAGQADPSVLGDEGPLWYRGYLQRGLTDSCPDLEQALRSLKADRMVVGHTTQRSGEVAVRCNGALLGIDTGISDHYGAHLAALELRGGVDAWALYPTGPEDLPDP
jgi:hypothetical protein